MDREQPQPSGEVLPEITESGPERVVACFVGIVVAAAIFLAFARPGDVVAPPARATDTEQGVVGVIVVHVTGAVRRPGVYELPAGARIQDAIAAAGGALRSADLASVNFAAPAVDGAQIVLARRRASASAPAAAIPSVPAVIDLNNADQAALESIPGIGPVTAMAILGHRAEIGAFTSLDQLLDVDGIGPATLDSLRPYITL